MEVTMRTEHTFSPRFRAAFVRPPDGHGDAGMQGDEESRE